MQVYIAGGYNGCLDCSCPISPTGPTCEDLSSAELFNPTSQGFTALPNPMTTPRRGAVAASLPDGTVLIAGGFSGGNILSSAEIYDPSTQTFTAVPNSMTTPRLGAIASSLDAGGVLIAGGSNGSVILSSAEIYDPTTKTFTALPNNMTTPRMGAVGAVIYGGALIAGGSNGSALLSSVELFDSQNFILQPFQLNTARNGSAATTFIGPQPNPGVPSIPFAPPRSVFVFGGQGNSGILDSVEVFRQPQNCPACPA